MIRALVSALLPIAFVLTPACGGQPERSPAETAAPAQARGGATRPDRPTACSLIGQTEMAEILGGTLAPPQSHEGLATTICAYLPPSDDSPLFAEVKIEWRAGESAMRAARLAQRAVANVVDASVSDPLTGLGDEATMIIGAILMVRKGETVITIDLQMQPNAREKGSAIARKLLERIGPA